MSLIRAIPAEALEQRHKPNTLYGGKDLYIATALETIDGVWKERSELENDPTYRQIIPYVIVSNTAREFVVMRRCKGQGEERLLGKHYMGAGGHVEYGHSLQYTAILEVTQELGLPLSHLEPVGMFFSDKTELDKVHVCFLYVAMTQYRVFTSPEGPLHEAQWVKREGLSKFYPTMEGWSQFAVDQFLAVD